MAIIRIPDLPNEATQLGDDDLILVEDVVNNETKKMKKAKFQASLPYHDSTGKLNTSGINFSLGKVGTNIVKNPNFLGSTIDTVIQDYEATCQPLLVVSDMDFHSGKCLEVKPNNTSRASLFIIYTEQILNALEHPIKAGDKLRLGFFVKGVGTNAATTIKCWNTVSELCFSDFIGNSLRWIEIPEFTYPGGNLNFSITMGDYVTTNMKMRVSGITIKNISTGSTEWVGYETNLIGEINRLAEVIASEKVSEYRAPWDTLPFKSYTLETNLIRNSELQDANNLPFSYGAGKGSDLEIAVVEIAMIPGTQITHAHKSVIAPAADGEVQANFLNNTLTYEDILARKNPIRIGDKLSVGYYAKLKNAAGHISLNLSYVKNGVMEFYTLLDKTGYVNDTWIWVQKDNLDYGGDDPFTANPYIKAFGLTGNVEVYFTGLMVKNTGSGSDINGYERNGEYEQEYQVKQVMAELGVTIGGNIACWGDSLTAANPGYPSALASILGVNVYNGGIGGQHSYHIRDRILADITHKNDFVIIWAGNNNIGSFDFVECVIEDIRQIISFLGHRRFLIIGIVNGDFDNRHKGESLYEQMIELNSRLEKSYPGQFLDIRSYLINQYDYKDTHLVASYVQPALGQNVTIQVNRNEWVNIGDVLAVGKFCQASIYTVMAKPDATHLTLRLDNSGPYDTGTTVNNYTSTIGGTTSIDYIKVLHKEDFDSFNEDIIPYTGRVDNIHFNTALYTLMAQNIADFIRGGKY